MGFPATGLGLQKLRKKVEEIGLMERSSDDGKSNLLTWQQRERCGAQAPGGSMIVPCPGGGEGGGGGGSPSPLRGFRGPRLADKISGKKRPLGFFRPSERQRLASQVCF